MTVAGPTEEQMAAAWADPKLANVLYHDWEATSYDDKWSISYDERCISYARDRFAAIAGTEGWPYPSALELGCGVGLSTLAATSAGFDVLSTDYYEDALDVTRANVFRNLGKIARTRLVDWRHLPLDLGIFDLIFASDVLYENEYAKLLPVLLRGLLSSDGIVMIADPGRVAAPVFVEACAEHGLVIRKKETRPFEAGEIKQKIDIYEIMNTDSSD